MVIIMTIVVLRTIFFYLFIFVIYRIMGKREVGQLSITDLIVSLLIAELTVISIENYKASILYSYSCFSGYFNYFFTSKTKVSYNSFSTLGISALGRSILFITGIISKLFSRAK